MKVTKRQLKRIIREASKEKTMSWDKMTWSTELSDSLINHINEFSYRHQLDLEDPEVLAALDLALLHVKTEFAKAAEWGDPR